MLATCNIESLRRANRFTFYAASFFIASLLIWHLLQGGIPGATWLLLLPWPVVEMGFIVDRTRLRSKLEDALASGGGVRDILDAVAGEF